MIGMVYISLLINIIYNKVLSLYSENKWLKVVFSVF